MTQNGVIGSEPNGPGAEQEPPKRSLASRWAQNASQMPPNDPPKAPKSTPKASKFDIETHLNSLVIDIIIGMIIITFMIYVIPT